MLLPGQEEPLQELLTEADFYRLQPLADIITEKLKSLENCRSPDARKGVLHLAAGKLNCSGGSHTSDDGRNFRTLRYTEARHDWFGVDLSFTVFQNIYFKYPWIFSGCMMKGCKFIECSFSDGYHDHGKTTFEKSDLTDAVFECCCDVPDKCYFGGATIKNAKFHNDWKPQTDCN